MVICAMEKSKAGRPGWSWGQLEIRFCREAEKDNIRVKTVR